MYWKWLWLALLVTTVSGKGKKHRHQKPGRAVLDGLASTTISEVTAAREADSVLLPAPLDVAPYSTVSANATCGNAGAEEYCRDTPGKRGVVCDICEGPDGSPSRRHPPSHATDSDPSTWWQSPSFGVGDHYRHVELIAKLPDKMELLHVIIKSGPSPRPLAWSLEVSPLENGDDWRMIRAFGDKEHCRRLWDLRPERRRRKARSARRVNRAEKITCSTQFTSPKPLENGEMHVAVGEGVTAMRVRVSFRAAHATTPRQQYYTVRTLTLAARCFCHGHASRCDVDGQGAKCECVHGTCGVRCQRCCSGSRWVADLPCDRHSLSDDNACACADRGACSYDDTGAIVCVNCTENRAGPLCDKCLFGFYSSTLDGPCIPCDCDPEGSDGSCEWDGRAQSVVCNCLEGFAGAACDSCAGRGTHPNCAGAVPTCRCDPRGIVNPAGVCDDICLCKANVVGERCDECAPGHFGLSADLTEGCRPCYCSHITQSCTLADPSTSDRPHDIILPLGEAWLITDAQANETVEPSIDEQGKPFVINYEVEGWENFYWVTRSFNGELLEYYGGEIRATLFWGIVRGDSGGNPTVGPDVILVATDGTRLAYGNITYQVPGEQSVSASLLEGLWYPLGEPDPEPCARAVLLDALRDLRALMLRAHYHYDQDEVRLEGVEVLAARTGSSEQCACPEGYAGAQCSRCAWTHVRVPHAPPAAPSFECVPCACNSHAACDTVEGPCGPCQHNTTGAHCERCLPGHYGNPVQGSCKPCACPMYEAANNFSPNCALASAEGDEYVCTQCPDGYTGDHCENCDFGYWGSPRTVGSRCIACQCGGSPCHPDTGRCLTCPPHAEGARCDLCKEGYWHGEGWERVGERGGACVPCGCGAGALAGACDARTGNCACREGWTGRACDVCAHGHGGLTAGCPVCRCGIAALNNICEPMTGECLCAPGAAPPSCDICLDEHYGLDITGCLGCNCSAIGAEGNACDIRSGQCRCKSHVTGRACDTCEEGYWGLERGGCRRCKCGSGASACDPVTGVCACALGVGGAQCDRCLPGYYGFGPTGCLPCPVCSEGKVCSAESGRCVCPGGSLGAGCRQCARGYWSVGPARCQPCRCGPGAISNTCDPHSGQCKCRTGWEGTACDRCAVGHHGPRCKPCYCHVAGTEGCRRGVCPCDARGQCPCKENVVGEKCDRCLDGTFGLTVENPLGCTACFCFGRAAHCAQAELARAALHAPAPLHIILQHATRGRAITTMDRDSLLAIHTHSPEATITLPQPAVPVYVELDKRFLGDRVTSYGGMLRFRVEEEGGVQLTPQILAKYPLVRIYGDNIVLDHYEPLGGAGEGNATHAVRLHESLWAVGGGVASRGALMVSLQRVRRLLVRATTRAPAPEQRVHALLLNVSLDTAIPGLSRSVPALGVELCACPREYSSSSCQEPAVGFWMPPPRVHVTTVAGTILINLEGDAQPCRCNNRASKCDPDTGHCLNCTGGSGGPRCEVCAPGYWGNPDSAAGCQSCPCPSRNRNYATGCAFTDGQLHCLCKPGYAGASCGVCAAGYTRAADGSCVRCACDPRGSVTAQCDARARCRCREFATGRTCDACRAPRTYMDNDGCRPCDNCTQTLLDSIEDVTSNLRRNVDPAELERIPKPFLSLKEYDRNSTTLRNELKMLQNEISQAKNLEHTIRNLENMERQIFADANKLKLEASIRQKEAEYLSLESMNALEEVLKQRRKLGEQVAALDDFARGEKHLSAHRALKEAHQLLKRIKGMKLNNYITNATDIADLANVQSKAVREYDYRIEDTYRRLRKLKSALDAWKNKAEDLPRLAQTVWNADDTVISLQGTVKPRLADLRDVGLRCRLMLEDISSMSTTNLTDAIGSSILRSQTLGIRFPSFVAELSALTLAAEEKEGILYNLTPSYKQKYLKPVEEHARDLENKAKEYKRLFAGSRAAAALGVSAAQAWRRVAEHVRDAALQADQAASALTAAAAITRGPAPLLDAAGKGRAASENLKTRGAAVLAKANELRVSLEVLVRGADVVRVALRGVGWRERELGARPAARVAAALAAAGAQADRVFATTRALYDEAADLRRRVRYHFRRQLAELQRHGDTALGAAQEHVSQIRGDTVRGAEVADALAAAAAARARQHHAAQRTLAPALATLRQKVLRATHAADTISVSVTSPVGAGQGCSRAYSTRAGGAGGAVTRLELALSFENLVRNGPLLHVLGDSKERKTYMKLNVEDKRLRLSWDLGAGEAVIVHPEVLQHTHDDADHTSYRIEIERVWNTVHLRVERAGGSLVSVSNSSGVSRVWLPARELWLGGAPEASEEQVAGLPGCVHALQLQGRALGLWNTLRQPRTARCTGCTHRWYSSGRGAEQTMVWFTGEGYAELRRSRLRLADRRQFSISFTFRTRDENALLFMALDTVNNRSVSVALRGCRVVFAVEYGGARLQIRAGGRHCAGRAAHVQAIRVFATNKLEKGSLRVNGEETLGSPSPPVQSAAALPDLADATYWVGGVPPGGRGDGLPAPLLGCLGALTVDREGYDLLDAPTRHGIEPRCGDRTLYSAILEGAGYIELPSPLIRRKAALGLSFRARAPDGLLLLRAPSGVTNNVVDNDQDDKHYLILTLVKGDLEVIASAGKGELRLRTNGTKLDDGRLHIVRLLRAHKQLEVWVDEERVGRGALAGGALGARPGGLYVGGVGPAADSAQLPRVRVPPFTGTVADLVLDAQLIGFETAVDWKGAQLGRADSAPNEQTKAEPRALQDRTGDNGCIKTASYTVEAGAVKFGDGPWSHATIRLTAKVKELTLALQFRTYATEGLLLLVPGSKAKPKHYMALMIREGRLRLVVRGRKRKEIALKPFVADGTWRSVWVRAGRARVSVRTAGTASGGEGGAAGAVRAHCARAQRVYVGGLPPPPALPDLPPAITRVGGYRGCVRRAAVNGRGEDLVRDAHAHHHVGQCFPNVERAAYFGGDAHAAVLHAWPTAETVLEIELEFRTSEPNGVLLTAGEVLLEVKDAAVVLSRQWPGSGTGGGAGPVRAGGAGPACDGAWHTVRARVQSRSLQLQLDGGPEVRDSPDTLLDEPLGAPPNPALYIAGLPDGVIDAGDGGKNFKGCIREVSISGQKREWTKMESLHNVLLDSCPIQ